MPNDDLRVSGAQAAHFIIIITTTATTTTTIIIIHFPATLASAKRVGRARHSAPAFPYPLPGLVSGSTQ